MVAVHNISRTRRHEHSLSNPNPKRPDVRRHHNDTQTSADPRCFGHTHERPAWGMTIQSLCRTVFVVGAVVMLGSPDASRAAGFADKVESFVPGSDAATTFPNIPLDRPESALGPPEALTGEDAFTAVVSPFNPPFGADEVVSIGEGGHLTLRLSTLARPENPGPHIGVFTNAGFADKNYPIGQAADVIVPNDNFETSFGMDRALVEVSDDGIHFVPINGGVPILFDIPTNGFADASTPFDPAPGAVPADPLQPFVGGLTDFNGLSYPDILDLLDRSAGGKWLDISRSQLDQVGFIRFSVANDGDQSTQLNFELDAVAVVDGLARPIPEPTALGVWALAIAGVLRCRYRSERGENALKTQSVLALAMARGETR